MTSLLVTILLLALATPVVVYALLRRVRKDVTAIRRAVADDLSSKIGAFGLSDVKADSSSVDYDSVMATSQRLVVLLNDGRTWLSVHRERLRKRFQDPSKETTIFLIDPESEMIFVLARKGSTTPDAIRAKIKESIQLVSEIASPNTQLEIFGHSLFNPHSIVLGDDAAIVMPYFVSRGGRQVPAFRFENAGPDSFFLMLRSDLESLRMDARDIRETKEGASMSSRLRTVP